MDIQISSNFERFLFDLCDSDAAAVCEKMKALKDTGVFAVSDDKRARARTIFEAGCATDDETRATIADVFKTHGYVLDPHTAVGVHVARNMIPRLPQPTIFLATADAAKFPETIEQVLGFAPPVPARISALIKKAERITTLPAETQKVKTYMEERKKV